MEEKERHKLRTPPKREPSSSLAIGPKRDCITQRMFFSAISFNIAKIPVSLNLMDRIRRTEPEINHLFTFTAKRATDKMGWEVEKQNKSKGKRRTMG